MTTNPQDLEIIENSREVNRARLIIQTDLVQLKQLLDDKKISAEIKLIINVDGTVEFQLYSGSKPAFPNSTGYGKVAFYWTRKTLNYDEAYNEALAVVKQVEGDMALQCAPWFDMSVYNDRNAYMHF